MIKKLKYSHYFCPIVRLSERSPFDGSCCGGYTGGDDTSSDSEPPPAPRYRIVLLGDAATGKTGEICLWSGKQTVVSIRDLLKFSIHRKLS